MILILLIVLVGAYFAYNYFGGEARKRAELKTEQERVQKLRESTRAAINKTVSNFDAISNWDEKLSEIVGDREILTMELQQLWLTGRPILFMGSVEDVAKNEDDQDTYSISMFYAFNNKFDFRSRLVLSLRCQKILLDAFLKQHPKVLSGESDIAVIANINKVNTHFRKVVRIYKKEHEKEDREEYEQREFVGVGLSLDIIELPVDFWL
jgi:hypothetical protein